MLLTLAAVFGTAFLAATILPFFSEVVVSAALTDENLNRLALWTAATAGNTLGAAVNWFLGRYAAHFQDRKWWPASQQQMVKGEVWFNKYGVWSLLLSWLPIGGDALTVIAGILHVRFDVFVVLVAIGKGARYAALIAGMDFVLF